MLSNVDKSKLAYEICCKEFGIKIDKDSRKRDYVYARACYFTLLKKHTYMSTTFIGDTLKKHHATVLHACREFENIVRWEPKIGNQYALIEQRYMNEIDKRNRAEQEPPEVVEDSLEALKMRVAMLEGEVIRLKMVEREFLKQNDKKAVVYNQYLDKLVLL